MCNPKIDLSKVLTKPNFDQFIEDNHLILSKTNIAKYFKVSRKTLYNWMHKNGYGMFIDPKKCSANRKQKEIIDKIPDDFTLDF